MGCRTESFLFPPFLCIDGMARKITTELWEGQTCTVLCISKYKSPSLSCQKCIIRRPETGSKVYSWSYKT